MTNVEYDKKKILRALDYLYKTPPSKWTVDMITRFKITILDSLISAVNLLPDAPKSGIIQEAKDLFS